MRPRLAQPLTGPVYPAGGRHSPIYNAWPPVPASSVNYAGEAPVAFRGPIYIYYHVTDGPMQISVPM